MNSDWNHRKAIAVGFFYPEADLLCNMKINTRFILQYLLERQRFVMQDLK